VAVTAGAAKAHPMMVSRITGRGTFMRKSPHRWGGRDPRHYHDL